MPLTPSFGDRRIGPIARLYRRLERKLLERLAKAFPAGIGTAWVWAQRLLMRMSQFRRGVGRDVVEADREMPALVSDALRGAWRDGVREARRDVPGAPMVSDGVDRLIEDTVASIRRTHDHVPRVLEGAYRSVIDEAMRAERDRGDLDRNRVVQRALDAFARRGVTGFVDARGRRWDLVSYVEMAVRSAITRAEVDGYCAQLAEAGHDLIVISDVAGSCPRCAVFEGRVLSISGATVGAIAREAASGRTVTVTVLCSVAEARARGLWHPGCRHVCAVWTPDDPAPPRAVRVSDSVRAERRRARAVARRERARQRVRFVAREN